MHRLSTRLRRAGALGVLALTALAAASTGSAQSSDTGPDPKAMALAASDFAAAKVIDQGFLKAEKPAVASYIRTFGPGAHIGSKPLLAVTSSVTLFATADVAAELYTQLHQAMGLKAGRRAFGKEIAEAFSTKLGLKSYAVSPPRSLTAGQGSFFVNLKVVNKIGTTWFRIGFTRLDRSIAMVMIAAWPGSTVVATDFTRATQKQDLRLHTAFTVANVAPATVTGTAAQGQTLTAVTGSWSGAPSAFAYQWARCDAAGTTCTDIAGATTASYAVVPEDVGSTLRVTVTASNTVTSLASPSAVTGAVV